LAESNGDKSSTAKSNIGIIIGISIIIVAIVVGAVILYSINYNATNQQIYMASLQITNPIIDVNQITILTPTVNGGTPPYTYQWYNATSGLPIPGATESSLIIKGTSAGTFYYYVIVTDMHKTKVTSNFEKVVVNPILTAGNITPTNPMVYYLESITLRANPSGGTPPYSYQWFQGISPSSCNMPINGATNSTFTASAGVAGGNYYCYKVTDHASTPSSNTSVADLITVMPVIVTTIPPSQVYSTTLISSGQVFSINNRNYIAINFSIPQSAYSINITGSYVSNGKVAVAILTPTQYGAFTQNTSSMSLSDYYYGYNEGSTINSQLSPGQYSLVFYDPGIITQDTITVINPIIVRYTEEQ